MADIADLEHRPQGAFRVGDRWKQDVSDAVRIALAERFLASGFLRIARQAQVEASG